LSQLTHRDRDAFNLSYLFEFDQEPREPFELPMREDCKGPVLAQPVSADGD
jgi:hypothetical protein